MFRLVKILWYDLIRFYKHVQTCQNTMIRFEAILKICQDLSQPYRDTIWYDSTNMFRLVKILWYDLMRFWKYVQTCHNNTMIRFDTILQTCSDLSKYYDTIWCNSENMSRLVTIIWYDLIRFYKSQTCLDLSKDDEIHQNCCKGLKFERIGNQNLTLTTTTKLF